MKNRSKTATRTADPGSRDEMRELAEALSLWRSAMHHVAARQGEASRPIPAPPAHRLRKGLLLIPALSAVVAAGVLVPIFVHQDRHPAAHAPITAEQTAPPSGGTRPDDTALMNQIDSELSEDVPDALRPLADPGDSTTSGSTITSEKKNVTHE